MIASRFILSTLSILLLSVSAFAVETKPKSSTGKGSRPVLTLDQLIDQTVSKGYATYFADSLGRLIDLPGDVKTRYVHVSTAQATDFLSHSLQVVVELSSDSLKPLALILSTRNIKNDIVESYDLKSNLYGHLESGIRIVGQRNADGKAIKGSGVITHLDISAPDVKERFQHELDLWLKGSYRKGSARKSK